MPLFAATFLADSQKGYVSRVNLVLYWSNTVIFVARIIVTPYYVSCIFGTKVLLHHGPWKAAQLPRGHLRARVHLIHPLLVQVARVQPRADQTGFGPGPFLPLLSSQQEVEQSETSRWPQHLSSKFRDQSTRIKCLRCRFKWEFRIFQPFSCNHLVNQGKTCILFFS